MADDWRTIAADLVEALLVDEDDAGGRRKKDPTAALRGDLESLRGTDTSLGSIAAMAELEPAEVAVLAVCGAIELDRRLQRLVAKLTADPTNGHPDVDLLIRLLGEDAVAALAPGARLSKAGLVDVEQGVPLAAARVSIPRTVGWALADELSLDTALPPDATVMVVEPNQVGFHSLLLVYGDDRVRRLQTAVTAGLGLAFVVTSPPADEAGWLVLVRQATVGGLAVVLELPTAPDPLVTRWLARADHLTWVLSSREQPALDTLPDLEFVEIAASDRYVTDGEWNAVQPDTPVPPRRPTAEQLRAMQRLPGSSVARVAAGALTRHATRVRPRATWDDLVLPAPQLRRLRDLVDRYRYRSTVHERWELPLYPSPGVIALFSGVSGTGKTTSAEVIAHELGVDMFRIDLSALVSKYIGETEKNLEEIFSAAHAGDYLLLFDEADALFGSRSAVQDARDRYANMEVSYLLQRVESYDGFVILTSNFQGNIDDAFLRRIHATVHFPMPSPEDRARIWDRCLAQAPRTELDLEFVAKTFELSGGSIRNASLTAAYAAAAAGNDVGMEHVLVAVAQEMVKLRQRVAPAQFGKWADTVASLT